jgi:predicted nuclease of predicted toxin-antitoxin system
MKLLFDHHLSRKLVARVADLFESSHVVLHGLDQASDLEVWTFARANGYTIVTKDNDFNDLSTLLGAPPKIIWLRIVKRRLLSVPSEERITL